MPVPAPLTNHREAELNQFLRAKLAKAYILQMCDMVTVCFHKVRATDEMFQEQCLLWERGACLFDFWLLKIQDLLHAKAM